MVYVYIREGFLYSVNVDIFKRINFQFTNLHMDLIWQKRACTIQNTRGKHFVRVRREFTACEHKSTSKISTFMVLVPSVLA